MLLKPLLQCHVYEAFHTHVTDTLGMLTDGFVHNIREVEVELVARSSVRICVGFAE